jgi:hypothetical protein
MKLGNAEKETVYRYTLVGYTEDEKAKLKKIAIERFANDEKAQIEYATLELLSDVIIGLENPKKLEINKELN